ncbi:hypothetical protein KC360_g2 [Hortaea werneckii]|nr:hypothetical protein KC344_g2 [Hortaea werneckii]KAI7180379.1 hypothetical protein KC360_g2 [Hortaea werneckii]
MTQQARLANHDRHHSQHRHPPSAQTPGATVAETTTAIQCHLYIPLNRPWQYAPRRQYEDSKNGRAHQTIRLVSTICLSRDLGMYLETRMGCRSEVTVKAAPWPPNTRLSSTAPTSGTEAEAKHFNMTCGEPPGLASSEPSGSQLHSCLYCYSDVRQIRKRACIWPLPISAARPQPKKKERKRNPPSRKVWFRDAFFASVVVTR